MQSLGTESVGVLFDYVTSEGRVCSLVVSICTVKQAEAFVVLCSEYGIFHAGFFGFSCPFLCIKQVGVEVFKIFVVLFLGYAFVTLYPFVTRRESVCAEMNKHTESVVNKPACIARRFSCNIA